MLVAMDHSGQILACNPYGDVQKLKRQLSEKGLIWMDYAIFRVNAELVE